MVFISSEQQLELMENIAAASGATVWEEVREEMWYALKEKYGQNASFEFEQIPHQKRINFIQWLKEDS